MKKYLSITLLCLINVHVVFAAIETAVAIEPSQSKIVNKEQYAYPFAHYEAFIAFMKGSPLWTDSVLRKTFPVSLYDSCVDSTKMDFFEVIYDSPNGYTRGWILRPHMTDKQLPVVIFNRGGFAKWGRIYPYELISLCKVATQGYAVIASDFRGKKATGLVGKQDKTDLGYGDVNDSFYLLEAAKKEYPNLDTDNIAVWGFSRGTSLSALMATRSDKIKLIIMQGMVADLVKNDRRGEFDEHVYPLLVDDYSTLPKARQDELLAGISPNQLIDQIKGNPRFLIFHGSKDKRTSPSDALLYANLLLKKNHNVEFHLYPDSGHVLTKKFNTYINEIINVLNNSFQ